MDRGAWWATVHEVAELDTTEWLHFHFLSSSFWWLYTAKENWRTLLGNVQMPTPEQAPTAQLQDVNDLSREGRQLLPSGPLGGEWGPPRECTELAQRLEAASKIKRILLPSCQWASLITLVFIFTLGDIISFFFLQFCLKNYGIGRLALPGLLSLDSWCSQACWWLLLGEGANAADHHALGESQDVRRLKALRSLAMKEFARRDLFNQASSNPSAPESPFLQPLW